MAGLRCFDVSRSSVRRPGPGIVVGSVHGMARGAEKEVAGLDFVVAVGIFSCGRETGATGPWMQRGSPTRAIRRRRETRTAGSLTECRNAAPSVARGTCTLRLCATCLAGETAAACRQDCRLAPRTASRRLRPMPPHPGQVLCLPVPARVQTDRSPCIWRRPFAMVEQHKKQQSSSNRSVAPQSTSPFSNRPTPPASCRRLDAGDEAQQRLARRRTRFVRVPVARHSLHLHVSPVSPTREAPHAGAARQMTHLEGHRCMRLMVHSMVPH